MQRPTVAIIGPGAIGSVIAGHFAARGYPVHLVGRNRRWLSQATKQGITISGGVFRRGRRFGRKLMMPAIDDGPAKKAKIDFAIFCVKSGDTRAAIKTSRHWIGPKTVVLALQNGLAHLGAIRSAFGKTRTVFGACYVAAERLELTRVHHHGNSLIVLAKNRDNSKATQNVQKLINSVRLHAKLDASENRALWTKTAFNAATNPIGALTGRSNGELAEIPALKELVLRTLKEAVAVAHAAGHKIAYKPLSVRLIAGLRAGGDQKNSMLQDLRAGRPNELDAIVKPFLEIAKKKQLETPLLHSLYRLMCRLSNERTL